MPSSRWLRNVELWSCCDSLLCTFECRLLEATCPPALTPRWVFNQTFLLLWTQQLGVKPDAGIGGLGDAVGGGSACRSWRWSGGEWVICQPAIVASTNQKGAPRGGGGNCVKWGATTHWFANSPWKCKTRVPAYTAHTSLVTCYLCNIPSNFPSITKTPQ